MQGDVALWRALRARFYRPLSFSLISPSRVFQLPGSCEPEIVDIRSVRSLLVARRDHLNLLVLKHGLVSLQRLLEERGNAELVPDGLTTSKRNAALLECSRMSMR
jgi:hypothetical protein